MLHRDPEGNIGKQSWTELCAVNSLYVSLVNTHFTYSAGSVFELVLVEVVWVGMSQMDRGIGSLGLAKAIPMQRATEVRL
jgi:hypothetical protein